MLDGPVVLKLPKELKTGKTGAPIEPARGHKCFFIRCRLTSGHLDFAPKITELLFNAVEAEQARVATGTFTVPIGVKVFEDGQPVAGRTGKLGLELDTTGAIQRAPLSPSESGPEVRFLDYVPATPEKAGNLALDLRLIGLGSGAPSLRLRIPHAQNSLSTALIALGKIDLWTLDQGEFLYWKQRPDFLASARIDADFVLDASTGEIVFGDGENGRIAPAKAAVLIACRTTDAGNGNAKAGLAWEFSPDDELSNRAVLAGDQNALDDLKAGIGIANRTATRQGEDAEDLDSGSMSPVRRLTVHGLGRGSTRIIRVSRRQER